jgi:hypothetical protein
MPCCEDSKVIENHNYLGFIKIGRYKFFHKEYKIKGKLINNWLSLSGSIKRFKRF